jgi:hypothetical protein
LPNTGPPQGMAIALEAPFSPHEIAIPVQMEQNTTRGNIMTETPKSDMVFQFIKRYGPSITNAVGWVIVVLGVLAALFVFYHQLWLRGLSLLVIAAIFFPPTKNLSMDFIEKKLHANYVLLMTIVIMFALKIGGFL